MSIWKKLINLCFSIGESDSVYRQNLLQGNFYKTLQEKGMYINQPDNYFFQGGSKTGNGIYFIYWLFSFLLFGATLWFYHQFFVVI
jgi:hypothetical protein